MGHAEVAFLWSLLQLVRLVEWLASLVLPSVSFLLSSLVAYLQRRKREAVERASADRVATLFVDRSNGKYCRLLCLQDIGYRGGKFWYTMIGDGQQAKMLTVVPLSSHCPLQLDETGVNTLNMLFHTLKHPFLQCIEEVQYFPEPDVVVTVQPLMSRGSLKDLIYKVSPTRKWSAKYGKYSKSAMEATAGVLKTLNRLHRLQHPLLHNICGVKYFPDSEETQVMVVESESSRNSLQDLVTLTSPTKRQNGKTIISAWKVASYGRQILQAILFLYEQGFPPLGHVHTGNIFVEGDVCRLGGYENTLLGYRSRVCEEWSEVDSEDLDVIMFGHVIFELACGYELSQLVPSQDDYYSVKNQEISDVLQVIFDRNKEGKFTSSIKKIHSHHFFQRGHLPSVEGVWPDHASLPSKVQVLLSQVGKGSPQKQNGRRHSCSIQ